MSRLLPPHAQSAARYWGRRALRKLPPEVTMLLRYVRPGSCAVDVGANMGLYTYALARRVSVHAFDPMPQCVEALATLADAGLPVTVHRVALSRRAGVAELQVPVDGAAERSAEATMGKPTGATHTITAPMRTLDSFDLRDVSVVKVDVEGHEAAVIDGASETIRRERPVLLVEFHQEYLDTPADVLFDRIRSFGYGAFYADAHGRPVALDRLTRRPDSYAVDPATGRPINNVLFAPA